MGAQGLAGYDVDRSPQFVFQQKRDGHEVVEGFFAGREFDQQIYVALRIGVVSLKRSKQADAADAESTQIVSVTAQAFNQVMFGLNDIHSDRKNCLQPRMLPRSITTKLNGPGLHAPTTDHTTGGDMRQAPPAEATFALGPLQRLVMPLLLAFVSALIVQQIADRAMADTR